MVHRNYFDVFIFTIFIIPRLYFIYDKQLHAFMDRKEED